jgi:phosphatidyl-myo-inositol dimannoside synthase
MKLLLITQYYYPFIGGVETHVRQVAQEFLRQGHEVEIVAATFSPCPLSARNAVLYFNLLTPAYESYKDGEVQVHALTPTLFDRLRMLPIAVRALPKLGGKFYTEFSRFGYPFYKYVFLDRLKTLMKDVDVVHSLAGNYLGWTAQAAAQELNIPFVCTPFVHPHQWGDDARSIEYYQQSDAVIGLLKSDRDYLESIGVCEEKLHTIGVSPDLPPTADPISFRQRHGLGQYPVVLYTGRMMPQKGAQALLNATEKVWAQNPEVRFVLIGPHTAESTHWFDNIDSRIQYLGKVSNQEKADALAACDVFCMPSMSEILPTVYLEAWSLGKAIVGGHAEGLPELIEGNHAGIAVSQNTDEIATALLKILQNSELYQEFGRSGQKMVEERYSVPAVVHQLFSLYTALQKIPTEPRYSRSLMTSLGG